MAPIHSAVDDASRNLVIALVDNNTNRHPRFRVFPGVHHSRKCFKIKHIHTLTEMARMMENDVPDFLFLGGWIDQYPDWRNMCELLIECDVAPRLVLLTTIDGNRAMEMMKYLQRHAPDLLVAHSEWTSQGYGMGRLEPREYWFDD